MTHRESQMCFKVHFIYFLSPSTKSNHQPIDSYLIRNSLVSLSGNTIIQVYMLQCTFVALTKKELEQWSTQKNDKKRSFRFISVNHHFHVTLERRIEKYKEEVENEKKRKSCRNHRCKFFVLTSFLSACFNDSLRNVVL